MSGGELIKEETLGISHVDDPSAALGEVLRANSSVLDCIARGFLKYEGAALSLSSIDRACVLFASALCREGGHLTINYPYAHCRSIPVLALEALYDRPDSAARPLVVCVSNEVAHRASFMLLRNAGGYLHKQCFPIGMLRSDGQVRDLSRVRTRGGRVEPQLIFSSSLSVPDHILRRTSAVVVDTSKVTGLCSLKEAVEEAARAGVPIAAYVTVSPLSPEAETLRAMGVNEWGWSDGLLRAMAEYDASQGKGSSMPFSPSMGWFRSIACGEPQLMVPVMDKLAAPALLEARQYCGTLLRAAIACPEEESIRKTAYGALHALEDLPCPSSIYDAEAESAWRTTSVSRRLELMERLSRRVEARDQHLAGLMTSTLERLRVADSVMRSSHTGKPVLVLEAVEAASRDGVPLSLIVRNHAARQALLVFLEHRGWDTSALVDDDIEILTPPMLWDAGHLGRLYFISLPRYEKDLMLMHLDADEARFIVYPSERPVLERIIYQQGEKERSLFAAERMLGSLSNLGARPTGDAAVRVKGLLDRRSYMAPKVIAIDPGEVTVEGETPSPAITDLIEAEIEASKGEEGGLPPEEGEPPCHEDGPVKALRIRFHSGASMLLRPTGHVTLYKDTNDSLRDVQVINLKAGDQVVLVNETTTQRLLDAVLEKVSQLPRMKEIIVYQSAWIDALNHGMERTGDTPSMVLEKLQREGSRIKTDISVHQWSSGLVLGPRSREDVERLGRIYGSTILQKSSRKVYRAIETSRRIHISLARNLRHLIKRAGTSRGERAVDIVVDEELQLYLEDFAQAVSVETVTDVSGPIDVDWSVLGRLEGGS